MLDRQKTFDTMVAHLRKQRERAANNHDGSCMYRTDTGLKCAVGVLIPDELYHPEIEGKLASDEKVIACIPGAGPTDMEFLTQAQTTLHDTNYDLSEREFKKFAMKYCLAYTSPA